MLEYTRVLYDLMYLLSMFYYVRFLVIALY